MYAISINDDKVVGIRDFRDVTWLCGGMAKLNYEPEFIEWPSYPELACPFLGM